MTILRKPKGQRWFLLLRVSKYYGRDKALSQGSLRLGLIQINGKLR